jgi:translation initiation factor 2A
VRSSNGIEVWSIENKDDVTASARVFKPIFKEARAARSMIFNEHYFAYGTNTEVKVFQLPECQLKYAIERPKSHILKFSPKGTFLIVYEIYISNKDNPNNSNLFFYEVTTGKQVASFVQKKNSEWEPFFNHDETMLALMVNGTVEFYDVSSSGFSKSSHRTVGKVGAFSVSPGVNTHVAVYVPGTKGSPSMARLFQYPNMESTVSITYNLI